MDGVVTDTAELHAEAWSRLFAAVLSDPRASVARSRAPFDVVTDYRRYVDGRAREDGVATFLAARGLTVPEGVVHHQDAVAMAEFAVERAQSEEVRALAERMIVGRRAQIETLTTLSAEWHKEPPAAAGPELDHAGLGIEDLDHRGVMDELEAASGPAFDQRFLQLMSAHHRGAITMAEEQRAQGQAPDALALAASMIDEHHRDIAVMERLATEP